MWSKVFFKVMARIEAETHNADNAFFCKGSSFVWKTCDKYCTRMSGRKWKPIDADAAGAHDED